MHWRFTVGFFTTIRWRPNYNFSGNPIGIFLKGYTYSSEAQPFCNAVLQKNLELPNAIQCQNLHQVRLLKHEDGQLMQILYSKMICMSCKAMI